MPTEIRQSIEQGFTLVTPTKRLGRALQQHYISEQLSAGEKVWETPDILPWAAWILRSWDDFAAQQEQVPLLLNGQQQQWIWQKIVTESSFAAGFLQPAAAANRAYEAWKIMRQWQLQSFPEDLWLNNDAFAFQSWVKTFQQQCKKHHWLDAASLEGYLLNEVPIWAKNSATKISLVGFDELTPVQEALLEAMKGAGCEIKHVIEAVETRQDTEIIKSDYADTRHEIKAIAHWLREQLKRDNSVSIGIVVPKMESLRTNIENIFDDVLTPGNLFSDDGEAHNNRPYNLSLGKPLSEYPIIHTAFAILGLEKKTIELEDLGALLRSPFLGGAESEMIARAKLDAHLREQGEPEIFLTILQQYMEKDEYWSEHCPQLIASLQKWREVFQSLMRKQSCTEWIESFISLLNTFSWPGERPIQGDEYQTMEAWKGLLDQFASLDLVSGELTYNGALSLLQRLAHEQTYQVESEEVPVQVMGLLEAAGMQFDQLWVMGLHEETWPSPARANPFIPIKLQRQENMPHASAERELEYARRITMRLAASANKVIFSSPLSEAGRELRPSPLLKDYSLQKTEQPLDINYAASIYDSSKIEHFHDERAPKVKEAQASGGTGLFKDQAACPFRAFARHRLGARSLDQPEIGLSPMQRGQLVHDCLQLFWEKISSHKELIESTEGALALHINQCVAKVIKRFQAKRPFTATARFMLIEQDRLQTMMREWLELERQRQPFTVIEREQKHLCSIEGLNIHTRMDRVDQLPDGSLIVIDYKTGKVAVASWMDERPDEPQLPLYAVTAEGNIAAVVFGQVKRGEMKFVGLSDDAYDEEASGENKSALIPEVKTLSKSRVSKSFTDWGALFLFWEANLKTLAKNYRKGDARVDPHKPNTCMYCDLGTLCRINELTQSSNDYAGNDAGDENE
jgi:ATP-dependent helicase/nuclease subunit B